MPKILLHVCCGPCSTAIIEYLQEKDFKVTGFFYNPNIQPAAEYDRRLESAQKYFADKKIDFIGSQSQPGYDKPWLQATRNKKSRPVRCLACYDLRMRETARYAAAKNFDAFTSTLLSSPHQEIEAIRKYGNDYSQLYNISFFSPDSGRKKYKGFRPLFTSCRQKAKKAELYEQEYCGCELSRQERFANSDKKE